MGKGVVFFVTDFQQCLDSSIDRPDVFAIIESGNPIDPVKSGSQDGRLGMCEPKNLFNLVMSRPRDTKRTTAYQGRNPPNPG